MTALYTLRQDVAACRICRDIPSGGEADRLPHEPRPVVVLSRTARILIAGQAPGLRAHQSGIPFTDASGDRLRSWLGVTSAQFYNPDNFAILPMGFCFPGYDANGSDLPPRRECAAHWRTPLIAAMPQISLVIAVGLTAQRWHLGTHIRRTMTETVENWNQYLPSSVVPLPHPSWRNSGWLRKNPWFESALLPEVRNIVLQWIS